MEHSLKQPPPNSGKMLLGNKKWSRSPLSIGHVETKSYMDKPSISSKSQNRND
jgi:hypothetical protein